MDRLAKQVGGLSESIGGDIEDIGYTVVWEVLVRADAGGRFEIYVDATTGAVVKVERDT